MIRFSSVLASLALAAAFVAPAQAFTVQQGPGTYNFSGTCLDCDDGGGATPATAQLIIRDDGPASFSYQSLLFNLVSDWVEVAQLGFFDAEGNADSWVLFGAEGATWDFRSDLAGSWSLQVQDVPKDIGRSGVWTTTRVPEPATLALVGLGLFAATRRRSKTA